MDVRFSAEQRALRDSVAQLVDRLRPDSVRSLDDAERVAKLDAAVNASGWRELRTADDDGAPWGSGVEVAIVAEQLALGAVDAAFIGPVLAADLRRRVGAPSDAAETIAVTTDLAALARADDGVLDGAAVAIDAAQASSALVLTGDGGLARVSLGDATTHVDLTRRVVDVAPGAQVTAVPGQRRSMDPDDMVRWTALGLALTSADLVGTMRGAMRLALDHAWTRQQYGVPIGSFQAVQHLLADAHVATVGSASVAVHAAWAVDALTPRDALAAAAAAKAYAARAAQSVCETVIQVHGGIGNTWECMAHVFLRRALWSSDLFGGVGANLARVLDHHDIGAGR